MTGQHTGHTTVRGNAKVGLSPEDRTVASLFQQAGYATMLAGKWGLGFEHTAMTPLHQGFDHYFGYLDQTHAHNYFPTFLLRDDVRVPLRNVVPDEGPYGQGVATVRLDYSAALVADDAVAFLGRQTRNQPFFLYYATTLPHANNEGASDGMEDPDRRQFASEAWPSPEIGFASMVARLDRDVGRIVAELDRLGLADNTLVIFTSDNGPHQKAAMTPPFSTRTAGSLQAVSSATSPKEVSACPLHRSRWPAHIKFGTISGHIGYFGDFFATAAELAGGTAAPVGLDSQASCRHCWANRRRNTPIILLGILREPRLRPGGPLRELESHPTSDARRPGRALRSSQRPRRGPRGCRRASRLGRKLRARKFMDEAHVPRRSGKFRPVKVAVLEGRVLPGNVGAGVQPSRFSRPQLVQYTRETEGP